MIGQSLQHPPATPIDLRSLLAQSLQGPQHPRSISTIPACNHLFRHLARPTSISATSPSIDQLHARHSSITVLTSNAPPFHRPPPHPLPPIHSLSALRVPHRSDSSASFAIKVCGMSPSANNGLSAWTMVFDIKGVQRKGLGGKTPLFPFY
jgi:hypothetical protein